MSELYNFTATDIRGRDFTFADLKGKVVLIVNTASKCGFTPQYDGLQALYEKYQEQGLVVLGFPSNDFLFQEPGSNDDIESFCRLNYGVSFPMFQKIHVRGGKAHPLFKYMTAGADNPSLKGPVKWNFTKFLFDREGKLAARFAPTAQPQSFEDKIQELIEQ